MDRKRRRTPMENYGATWKRRPPSSAQTSGTKLCPMMPTWRYWTMYVQKRDTVSSQLGWIRILNGWIWNYFKQSGFLHFFFFLFSYIFLLRTNCEWQLIGPHFFPAVGKIILCSIVLWSFTQVLQIYVALQ